MTLHPSHFLDELRRHPAGVVLITGNNRMPRPGAVPYRCDQLADALEALALLAASASADLFEQCERVAEQPRNVIDRPQDTVPASHGAAPQRPVPLHPVAREPVQLDDLDAPAVPADHHHGDHGTTCEQCQGAGVLECWDPGGPCPEPNAPGCETCGPCSSCRPCATRCAGNVPGGPACGCPPTF